MCLQLVLHLHSFKISVFVYNIPHRCTCSYTCLPGCWPTWPQILCWLFLELFWKPFWNHLKFRSIVCFQEEIWTWKIHKLCQGVPLPAFLCTLEHIIRYTARGHPLTQSTYHPVCVYLVGFKWMFGRGSCSWRPCSSTGGGPFVAIFSRMVRMKQQETSN